MNRGKRNIVEEQIQGEVEMVQSQGVPIENREVSMQISQEDNSIRELQRSFGKRIPQEKLDILLGQNQDNLNQVFFTITSKIFAIFIPEAIKKYVSQQIICVGGILVACCLFGAFFYLYFTDQCSTLYIETSQKGLLEDVKVLQCNATALAKTDILRFDVNGQWSGERDFDKYFGGPWEINFKNYENINDKLFQDNITALTQQSYEKIESLKNQTFFQILEDLHFYKFDLNGTKGVATLQTNIDPSRIFENYQLSGFEILNLKDILQHDLRDFGRAQINSNWSQLNTEPCNQINSKTNKVSSKWECKVNADYVKQPLAEISIIEDEVTSSLHKFYEVLNNFLFPNVSSNISGQNSEQIEFTWNFKKIFTLDYCNNGGFDKCYKLFVEGKNSNHAAWPYFTINIKNNQLFQSRKPLITSIVYIKALKQFGQYITHEYIYAPKEQIQQKNNYLNKYGTTVEYIMVPQLLASRSNNLNVYGVPYYPCESCSEREEYLKQTNMRQLPEGSCNEASVLMHVYAFPFQHDISKPEINQTDLEFSLEKNYLATFLYKFKQEQVRKFSYFTENYTAEQISPFIYNDQLSQVKYLHCDPSNWTINLPENNSENITVPFTLTTGIESCEIQQCPNFVDRIAQAQANAQFIYMGIVIVIIILFFMFFIKKIRAHQSEKREKFSTVFF